MIRLPVPNLDLKTGGPWTLTKEQVHYAIRVRRLTEGDEVEAFDGRGYEVTGRLSCEGPRWTLVSVGEVRQGQTGADLTVIYGLPKGEKLDRVVRQLTELGVGTLVPLLCDQSVVRLKGERVDKKRQRLTKIADEAARQCGRADTMAIDDPVTLDTHLAKREPNDVGLVFDPRGCQGLELVPLEGRISLFIGPESGFSARELKLCQEHGLHIVSIGQLILRTETAAPVCTALVLHRLGLL